MERMKYMKAIRFILTLIVLLVLVAGCSHSEPDVYMKRKPKDVPTIIIPLGNGGTSGEDDPIFTTPVDTIANMSITGLGTVE